MTSLTAVVAVMAWFAATAFGVSGSPSGFESNDANMVVGTANNTDWNCFTSWPTTGTGAINVGASCSPKANPGGYSQEATNPAHVDPTTAGNGNNDVTWKAGQKMDTACPALTPDPTTGKGTGGAPSKDTITNFAQYVETASSGGVIGDTYIYGGTIREAANGNANENIEFNQLAATPTCAINRSQGDKLIAIDYTGGGGTVGFHVYTWVSNATGAGFTDAAGDAISGTCLVGTSSSVSPSGCWSQTIKNITSTTYADGNVNALAISAANNGISDQNLLAGEFAEFGVNLAGAGIIPSGSCQGFAQTVYETRSSSSFSSNPEDIEFDNKPISNCGTINIIKATSPAGRDKAFSFTSNLTPQGDAGGVACSATDTDNDAAAEPDNDADDPGVQSSTNGGTNGSFCLNAGASASGGNEVSENSLAPGTYNVTEGSPPSGYTFDNVNCTSSTGATVPTNQTSSAAISLSLTAGETITCTYTNDQQLGALQIVKENVKHTSTKLSGAQFTITDPNGHLLSHTVNGTSTTTFTTDANGEICVDNLTPLGLYKVTETGAPTNYGLPSTTDQTLTVSNVGANGCGAATFVGTTFTFVDPPLTTVTVTAQSDVASPDNTSSKVSGCTDTSGITGTSWSNSGSSFNDPASASRDGFLPTGSTTFTVTCTVQIDP